MLYIIVQWWCCPAIKICWDGHQLSNKTSLFSQMHSVSCVIWVCSFKGSLEDQSPWECKPILCILELRNILWHHLLTSVIKNRLRSEKCALVSIQYKSMGSSVVLTQLALTICTKTVKICLKISSCVSKKKLHRFGMPWGHDDHIRIWVELSFKHLHLSKSCQNVYYIFEYSRIK